MVRLIAVSVSVLAIASCSHASSRADAPGPNAAAPKVEVLVTIGSDATFGDGLENPLSDSWPQKLYHEAFPRSAVLVNASEEGAVTVDRAAAQQVPLAIEVQATVVAVWLGDADFIHLVPVATFESKLGRLVRRLRDSGARVLLGNLSRTPPGAAAYDDAIASVARTDGATLVDVAAALSATPNIAPSSPMDPKTSGKIARAFAAALARS